MSRLIYLSVLLVIHFVAANPDVSGSEANVFQTVSEKQMEDSFLKKLNLKCSQRDNSSCIMLKLVTYMNRMLKKSSIALDGNVELIQTRTTYEKEDPYVYARAQGSDEATLGVILADKLWTFFKSRSLKWKPAEVMDFIMSSNEKGKLNFELSLNTEKIYEEGRGKMKNSGHIVGALVAKAALVGALIFKGLVLLVGKALVVSKLAFLLASILAIKKLLNKKHITYEVVAHPVHDHHHEHPVSGWGRALDVFIENALNNINPDGDKIAFEGQKP
ncbi:uncharacterized protein LOC134835324 [Culicoides brevitarsis]|uniref:uncharacterized protein LOC134835324 n=1 Tax=Culicoides brevitarsis TaxID=469753 RepID=UPI00307CA3B5